VRTSRSPVACFSLLTGLVLGVTTWAAAGPEPFVVTRADGAGCFALDDGGSTAVRRVIADARARSAVFRALHDALACRDDVTVRLVLGAPPAGTEAAGRLSVVRDPAVASRVLGVRGELVVPVAAFAGRAAPLLAHELAHVFALLRGDGAEDGGPGEALARRVERAVRGELVGRDRADHALLAAEIRAGSGAVRPVETLAGGLSSEGSPTTGAPAAPGARARTGGS
jgi:hypothetical protein